MTKFVVLIIDDQEMDRYILKRDLTKIDMNLHTYEASDGKVALELLSSSKNNLTNEVSNIVPEVIFLDVNMPLISGFEFLERFSELRGTTEDLKKCKVLILSSSEHPVAKDKAFSYEFVDDFIVQGKTSRKELQNKLFTIREKFYNLSA